MTDPIVFAIVGLALLATPLLGWFSRPKDEQEFISAGRRITLPVFVATLVCTWYGGILGVGELSWSYGLVNWLALGVFYYIFAAFYAFFLAGKIREGKELSIPERIGNHHGPLAGKLAAVYTLLMVSPAPYLLMTAVLLKAALGLSLTAGMGWAVLLTVLYVWRGGLRSVLTTDILQFIMMFLAFGLGLGWLVFHYGGMEFLHATLPAKHLSIPGEMKWSTVFVWGMVAMWTLVDPGFHQRVAVAKDSATARKGILISIAFWVVFDGLTTFCGLYARALIPNLSNPVDAFPLLAALMPPVLQGIFFSGLLVTVLSTLDSFTFLSGQTVARDIFGSRGPRQVFHTRVGIVAMSWVGAMMALKMPSVVKLWLTIASLGIPVLLPALMSSYWTKTTVPAGPRLALSPGSLSMLAGATVSAGCFFWGQLRQIDGWPQYPLGLEPLFPGLLISVLVMLAAGGVFGRGRESLNS